MTAVAENATKPRLNVMTMGDDNLFSELDKMMEDLELGGIDHFSEKSDAVDGSPDESDQESGGNFVRSESRRLMVMLQMNNKDKPIALDNLSIRAVTSTKTFDICHDSRCLQYRDNLGFFLRLITNHKQLEDTDYVFDRNDRTMPHTGLVEVDNGGPVLVLELVSDSRGHLIPLFMNELKERIKEDPTKILSMITLVNCSTSCVEYDLAIYFSSRQREQRFYITPNGTDIQVHFESKPKDKDEEIKLFFRYNEWSKMFDNHNSSTSNGVQ